MFTQRFPLHLSNISNVTTRSLSFHLKKSTLLKCDTHLNHLNYSNHFRNCTNIPSNRSISSLSKNHEKDAAKNDVHRCSNSCPCHASRLLRRSIHTPANSPYTADIPFLQKKSGSGSIKKPSTFVSTYFKISQTEIKKFLDQHEMEYKLSGQEFCVKDCPFCHDTKDKPDNFWKLYIHQSSGAFLCHRCSTKGSWFDFKILIDNGGQYPDGMGTDQKKKVVKLPKEEVCLQYEQQLFENEDYQEVLEYLVKERGLTKETLKKYGVGSTLEQFRNLDDDSEGEYTEKLSMTFPMYENGRIVRHKIRALHDKRYMSLSPIGGKWGLFGLNTVPEDSTELIITEGEFDAMSVYQATGRPAISVPNGCNSLPIDILPLLERFEKIYLWFDDDVPGQQGLEQFSKKLGIGRCLIVKSNYVNEGANDPNRCKDANEALLLQKDLVKLLEEASRVRHDRIITFDTFKGEIFNEFYGKSSEVQGVQSRYLPKYNEILKGVRAGELTVFTGPTGIGKTTILGQLTMDFCEQGLRTLWGSFEVRNHRLVSSMMCQLAGRDLRVSKDNFDLYSERFQQLPMYFMNFFGSTSVDQVISAMDYAVYVYDVQHIVIDNLQFMVSGQGRGYDKFEIQDRAIETFRHFASERNVHVSLVIHPRKESDKAVLGISSVFGTAKATQEADNVVILQRGPLYRSLMVKKNRFDGTLGEIPYAFFRDSKRIIELSESEIEEVEGGRMILEY